MSAALTGSGFVTAPPADELPTASQSTLLLQKKKEMAEVQQQLDRKKDEFRQRMQRCQEKEVDLAARQEAIKEQVRKFDKFLKDNDAKRVRALRKAGEENRAREQKDLEKIELMKQYEKKVEEKNTLQEELQHKGIYQEFLDNVCDTTEYFEGIENIMNRHMTLAAAKNDLRMRVDTAQQSQEEQTTDLNKFGKEGQNDLLVYNSDIAAAQKKLDTMRYESQDKESALYRHESEAKEGTRQLGEIKMAIQNIYLRCVKVRGPSPESMPLFLEAIQQRIVDLQAIVTGHDRPLARHELQAYLRDIERSNLLLDAVDPAGGAARGAAGKVGDASGPHGTHSRSIGGGNTSPGSTQLPRASASLRANGSVAADGTHGSRSQSMSGSASIDSRGGPMSKSNVMMA